MARGLIPEAQLGALGGRYLCPMSSGLYKQVRGSCWQGGVLISSLSLCPLTPFHCFSQHLCQSSPRFFCLPLCLLSTSLCLYVAPSLCLRVLSYPIALFLSLWLYLLVSDLLVLHLCFSMCLGLSVQDTGFLVATVKN